MLKCFWPRVLSVAYKCDRCVHFWLVVAFVFQLTLALKLPHQVAPRCKLLQGRPTPAHPSCVISHGNGPDLWSWRAHIRPTDDSRSGTSYGGSSTGTICESILFFDTHQHVSWHGIFFPCNSRYPCPRRTYSWDADDCHMYVP